MAVEMAKLVAVRAAVRVADMAAVEMAKLVAVRAAVRAADVVAAEMAKPAAVRAAMRAADVVAVFPFLKKNTKTGSLWAQAALKPAYSAVHA
jgi:hypothetical protein